MSCWLWLKRTGPILEQCLWPFLWPTTVAGSTSTCVALHSIFSASHPARFSPFWKTINDRVTCVPFVHTSLHVEEANFSAGVAVPVDAKIVFQQSLQAPVVWFQQCLFRSYVDLLSPICKKSMCSVSCILQLEMVVLNCKPSSLKTSWTMNTLTWNALLHTLVANLIFQLIETIHVCSTSKTAKMHSASIKSLPFPLCTSEP